MFITLTVTDLAGNSATVNSKFIIFYPQYAEEPSPQAPCPFHGRPLKSVFEATSHYAVAKGSLFFTTRCLTVAPCAGSLSVRSLSSVRGRIGRVSRPPVLAALPFFTVPSHRSLKLRAKLTAAGRRLLARGGPVHASARLTTIEPSGARKVRVQRVLLKRR